MNSVDATPDTLHGDIWMNTWNGEGEEGKSNKTGGRVKMGGGEREKEIQWNARVRNKHEEGLREKWRETE